MKKTLIAAGIAAVMAAPVAMADVKVSGQVKTWLANDDSSDGQWAPAYDNSVTFSASEDLGNGLSAFASITIDTDSTGTNTLSGKPNKDQKVGLKGSFGTFVIGQMEYLTEGVVTSMMDDGLSSHGANAQLETSLSAFGRDNAVAYVSPTVNGFHVAVAGSTKADNNTFTNNDILVAYDNGPLSIKASRADVRDTYEVIAVGATYKMGDAKISALTVEKDFDAASSTDLRDNMIRLDYKMGNNTLTVGHKDADNDHGTAEGDVTTVKVTHSLSKQTSAWVGMRFKDKTVSSADDVQFIGMMHKF